ncbi:cytochrome c biogenesis protein CcdA [Micromonospora aurantiaca]|jgi:cytochrome c-type biogenesis protein|uniref:Cytochrome C biogenesis protein CcdA n=1 Tax=Micromonospora aurantiaca (nom. illeg.) TaxID=47850 RepID=A0A3M9JZD2_9ACTN|nr:MULTISPECIES: cytochrome c biogenesis protein CcdA [Micromonospora]ADU09703.1 cytochrome c biogenesis protein transmembrane region [Micromonospora sp. L5]AXH94716.1 cytochrome C biogenesis protein CcdA [Micromonospora aurantiaca]KAB1108437.1 cytochrome C biogenesis protein CcdA [Micromonospora aurantiaca]MBC9004364.1 cytochrome C biogenesis protein CcdA [Micromonospora aurantiaca]MDG4752850.1 cytochrome c biogenesis protein CcdA [Micromonospora sp. WMMD718]
MGEMFAGVATSGPLLLALGVAALAGLASFLSPCVLPLVPGYVSYVTGMAGEDVSTSAAAGTVNTMTRRPARGRLLAGTLLFVAGFTVVFILTAVTVASAGRLLLVHARTVEIIAGALTVVLGLSFLGLVPAAQYERRLRRLPAPGLAGAPLLGVVFGVGWVPCVSPTLGAVLALAAVDGTTGRAVALAVAYCVGLGAPFVLFGLGLRRVLAALAVARRHSRTITRVGGVLLVVVGVALMTGWWSTFTIWLRATVGPGQVGI